MNINVHIERLILDGLSIGQKDGAVVQTAVETELERLLTDQRLDKISGGAVPSISGGSLRIVDGSNAVRIGNQVAGAIYASLQPPTKIGRQSSMHGGNVR